MHALRLSLPILIAITLAPSLTALASDDVGGLVDGIQPGAELILDAVHNGRGGDAEGSAFLGKLSLTLDLDSGDAGRWRGTHARVLALGTFGDKPSSLAGDLQVTSNIEAPTDFRLFEAWIEQSFGERASIRAGYSDFNSEFDVATMAAGLLNSSFGVGPEISQVGPSIFPRTYPGLRLRLAAENGMYVLGGGWRGVPYALADSEDRKDRDGTFSVVEAGWTRESFGRIHTPKLSAGFWRFAAAGDGVPRDAGSMSGYYFLAEAETEIAGGRRLGAFVRAGRAENDCHPIREYVGTGVRLASISSARPDDELAFAVAHARLAPRERARLASRAETTIELNWTIQATPTLAIVPDVQYVIAPAGGVGAKDALLFGVRAVVSFD